MSNYKPVRRKTVPEEEKLNHSDFPIPPERLIFVITALYDPEQIAVEKYLKAAGAIQVSHRLVEKTRAILWQLDREDGPLYIATKCLRSAGNGKSGVEFMQFAMLLQPQLTCFCGIAGSLNPKKAPLGSVVASTEIHWLGYDKLSKETRVIDRMREAEHSSERLNINLSNLVTEFIDREAHNQTNHVAFVRDQAFVNALEAGIDSFSKETEILKAMEEDLAGFDYQSLKLAEKPKMSYGPIVSWEYVLNDREKRELLLSARRQRLAVEMESGAPSFAAKNLDDSLTEGKICYMSVRGISDLCHVKTDDVFRLIASEGAAAVLIGFLKHRYDPDLIYDRSL